METTKTSLQRNFKSFETIAGYIFQKLMLSQPWYHGDVYNVARLNSNNPILCVVYDNIFKRWTDNLRLCYVSLYMYAWCKLFLWEYFWSGCEIAKAV